MNFFFDNNISPNLAKAMNLLEEGEGSVKHLKDRFPGDERDENWLPHVGNNDLILITRDRRIRRRPAELSAYKRYKVGAFILTGKVMTKWQGIKQLILAWEEIKRLNIATNKPYAFQIPLRGKPQRLSL